MTRLFKLLLLLAAMFVTIAAAAADIGKLKPKGWSPTPADISDDARRDRALANAPGKKASPDSTTDQAGFRADRPRTDVIDGPFGSPAERRTSPGSRRTDVTYKDPGVDWFFVDEWRDNDNNNENALKQSHSGGGLSVGGTFGEQQKQPAEAPKQPSAPPSMPTAATPAAPPPKEEPTGADPGITFEPSEPAPASGGPAEPNFENVS